jgi:uncharacterized oxidoreductase
MNGIATRKRARVAGPGLCSNKGMKLKNNTILVTGGASGIGRGLAEALHRLGNQVIISGRRTERLAATVAANPGMRSYPLDIADSENIRTVMRQIVDGNPNLNVLVNNAGIMLADDSSAPIDEALLASTVTTNLLGPIRVTGSLIGHLKRQKAATVINVTSVLGFVPLAMTAVYCATKAAMHSYSQSMRYMLRGTSVEVLELAPPWVRTELMNSQDVEQAMPLADFIAQAMTALETGADEILVEAAGQIRSHAGPNNTAFVAEFNDRISKW